MMITASHAGDYQHDTDSVVSIERIGLSVFVLHRPIPCPYPLQLFVSFARAAYALTRFKYGVANLLLLQLLQTQVLKTDDIIALWML